MRVTVALLPVVVGLLFCGGTEAYTSAVNPGFRTILTQKGLSYADAVGFPLLKKEIGNFTIPDITTSYKVPVIGTVNFTLSNIALKSLNFGYSSLTTSASGLTLTDNGISMAMSADWSYDQESWPHLKGHGSVDISGSGVSLKLTVDVTMNKTSGGVHLNCSYCSIGIDHLSVKFHGGESWFYNLFTSVIEGQLKSYINSQMCSELQSEVNTAGNSALDRLINVTYTVGDGVEIDYALVANPNFSHPGLIIFDNKGEFKLVKDPQDPPFSPPSLPDPSLRNLSHMLYVQATTYVAESASWAFWKAGLMQYNLSNDKIPTGFKKTGFYCDIVSPELCRKYPNKEVMFGVVANDYPRLKVTPEYAVMIGRAHASMYVDNNGREELAFTLALDGEADMTLSLNHSSSGGYIISGNVSNPRINVSLYHSNIGPFNCSTLKNIITTLAPSLGLAYINKYANAGVPIPTVEGFSFVEPSFTFEMGYVEVSGNVNYNGPDMLEKMRKGL